VRASSRLKVAQGRTPYGSRRPCFRVSCVRVVVCVYLWIMCVICAYVCDLCVCFFVSVCHMCVCVMCLCPCVCVCRVRPGNGAA
jgi:hypothetical protein